MRAGYFFACLFATTALVLPISGSAQGPAQTRVLDQWGLTAQDWLWLDGATVRKKAGLPASLAKVRTAAERGDAKAAAILGSAYSVGGFGPEQDVAQAQRWLKLAADQGIAFAAYGMAALYINGNIQPLNRAEGMRWMTKAADGGHARASYYIGLSLIEDPRGNGTSQPDPIKGRNLIENAAEGGIPEARNLTEIWTYNEAFVEAARGMPLWKDGRGLLRGHGDRMFAWHPCRTDVFSDRGGRWTIDWSQTVIYGGAKGTAEFVGVIWVHEVNQSSKVFGFFEYEGASRNLERSRANFAKIKEMGDLLHQRCAKPRA